jgi:hypothetical protein
MPQTGPRTVAIICSNHVDPIGSRWKRLEVRTMTSIVHKPETRQRASLAEARTAPDGGFKRLALPAVAAAVQTLARAKPRQPAHQEWPALPRRDGKPS